MQVIAVMGQGGAERMALQLATDGARHGEPAAIAAEPGDWADRVAGSGAQFYPVPLLRRSPLAVVEGVRALRGAVNRFRPDIVHTHNVVVTVGMRGALTTVRRPAAHADDVPRHAAGALPACRAAAARHDAAHRRLQRQRRPQAGRGRIPGRPDRGDPQRRPHGAGHAGADRRRP